MWPKINNVSLIVKVSRVPAALPAACPPLTLQRADALMLAVDAGATSISSIVSYGLYPHLHQGDLGFLLDICREVLTPPLSPPRPAAPPAGGGCGGVITSQLLA